jgi:modulator of FtsH protease HflK
MPWNSDEGGGGQGPWGQGPRNQNNRPSGNRGPGGSGLPPDLDDLLKKGADSLKNAIPGGAGRGSWLLPVVLIGAYWLYNSFYQVQPDEKGVVLRLGQYDRTVDPGLHFAMWPIERIERPKVGTVRSTEVNEDDQMLTSDRNILNVDFTVQWRIASAQDFLFNVEDQARLVSVVGQSAMREVVGQTAAQDVLTDGRSAVAARVLQIAQGLLDQYKSGVILTAVNLGDVQPPAEVVDAFNEVNRADQNRTQLENEAQQYRNKKLQIVEGETAKMIEDASAYKSRVIADSQGEAARFLSVYEQYKNAKDVTRQRLFLETMEEVLSQSNKVIVEGGNGNGGSGVVPYLPLPEIQQRRSTQPSTQTNQ